MSEVWAVAHHRAFAMSPDGRTIAVVRSGDHKLVLIDVPSWKERAVLAIGIVHFNQALAFSPDSETLAVATEENGKIQLWDARSGTLRTRLRGPDEWVEALAFHPNGQTIAMAGYWGVEVRRLADGASVRLTALPSGKADGEWIGLVTAKNGRWGGNPEAARFVRVRRADEDLRSAAMPAARLRRADGWRPSLVPDLLAGSQRANPG
jgi:hypothetical protein